MHINEIHISLNTTGFGDIVARTSMERAVAMLFLGLGVAYFSFLVSSFTTMISSASQEARR